MAMLVEHLGRSPQIHDSAWVAPSATVSGDVEIGPHTRVLHGAVLTSEGGSISIGSRCVIMENSVLRATRKHPLAIGNYVLIGPNAHVSGCRIGDEALIATGAAVFNGATIGAGAEVRINGTVHIDTDLPDEGIVPIGWVAVGSPPAILPASNDEEIWERLRPLSFPKQVFGVERSPEMMIEIMTRYTTRLATHNNDTIIEQ